jgi:hypothetical protein
MRFLDFKQNFADFNAITSQDIRNAFGNINQSQLSVWKNKGLILSVKKGLYTLSDTKIDLLLLANEINDSYLSLEFALSYHQIIPEITPSFTSISNNRNEDIHNNFGNFYYHKISSKLFCGFTLMESQTQSNRYIRIAEKEKALFDLIYLRKDLRDTQDFKSLRLNMEKINPAKLKKFISLVEAPQIKKRLNNFLDYLYAISK